MQILAFTADWCIHKVRFNPTNQDPRMILQVNTSARVAADSFSARLTDDLVSALHRTQPEVRLHFVGTERLNMSSEAQAAGLAAARTEIEALTQSMAA
jgi:hypothetical protein